MLPSPFVECFLTAKFSCFPDRPPRLTSWIGRVCRGTSSKFSPSPSILRISSPAFEADSGRREVQDSFQLVKCFNELFISLTVPHSRLLAWVGSSQSRPPEPGKDEP